MVVASHVGAPGPGNPPRLAIVPVLRRSWEVWCGSRGLFLAAAAIVQIPVALAAVVAAWATGIDIDSANSWQYIAVAFAVALWATLGHHVVLAIAERIEAAQETGQEPHRGGLLRDLPWLRLALADVVVLVVVVAGIVAFVIPGVVLAVLLAPAFPLLAMEDQPVLPTLRRSWQLVRSNFFPALVLIAGTWAVTQLVGVLVAALGEAIDKGAVVEVVLEFAVDVVLGSLGAVVVVTTTFRLVQLDRARSGPGHVTGWRGPTQTRSSPTAAPDGPRLLGIFIPLLAFFGAVRVGRPGSPWARWRYRPGSARLAEATGREARRTWLIRLKERLQDLVAERPHLPSS